MGNNKLQIKYPLLRSLEMFEIRIENAFHVSWFTIFLPANFVDFIVWKLYFLRINCDLCSDRSLHEIHFKSTELNNNFTNPFETLQLTSNMNRSRKLFCVLFLVFQSIFVFAIVNLKCRSIFHESFLPLVSRNVNEKRRNETITTIELQLHSATDFQFDFVFVIRLWK